MFLSSLASFRRAQFLLAYFMFRLNRCFVIKKIESAINKKNRFRLVARKTTSDESFQIFCQSKKAFLKKSLLILIFLALNFYYVKSS